MTACQACGFAQRRPRAGQEGQHPFEARLRQHFETLERVARRILAEQQQFARRLERGAGRPRSPCDRRSREAGASVAAVTMPSVPSDPISSCLRSKPRLSFFSGVSAENTAPSASTASSPSTSARIDPWRSTWLPPALVETRPPIVAEPLPPSVSGKRSPAASAASCSACRMTPASQVDPAVLGIDRADRVHPPQRNQQLAPARIGRGAAGHAAVAALRDDRRRGAARTAASGRRARRCSRATPWPGRCRYSARASRSARARSDRRPWSARAGRAGRPLRRGMRRYRSLSRLLHRNRRFASAATQVKRVFKLPEYGRKRRSAPRRVQVHLERARIDR